jgi:hypothetical protein
MTDAIIAMSAVAVAAGYVLGFGLCCAAARRDAWAMIAGPGLHRVSRGSRDHRTATSALAEPVRRDQGHGELQRSRRRHMTVCS